MLVPAFKVEQRYIGGSAGKIEDKILGNRDSGSVERPASMETFLTRVPKADILAVFLALPCFAVSGF